MVGVKGFGPLAGMIVSTAKNIISNVIAEGYILPNQFLLKVKKDLPLETYAAMKSPPPLGLLQIEVVEAENLPAVDRSLTGAKTSDPYVQIKVGFHSLRTSTIENSVNPKWHDPPSHLFVYNVAQRVQIDVWDDDLMGDDMLGNVNGYSVYWLCKECESAPHDGKWFDVSDPETKQPAGRLKIKATYHDVCDLGELGNPAEEMKTATVESPPHVLTVKLLGLECTKSGRGDLRACRAMVELVRPAGDDLHTDAGATASVNNKKAANRFMKGLEMVGNAAHEAHNKLKKATGLGFGLREDGVPRKRKSGKSMNWASQVKVFDASKRPIPAFTIQAMEKLHIMEGFSIPEIADMFQVPEETAKKAVDSRGNFEAVWHEAIHFLQPAVDPFSGKFNISVTAPKNQVRGANANGLIGEIEIDLSAVTNDATKEGAKDKRGEEDTVWVRRIRKELCRTGKNGKAKTTDNLEAAEAKKDHGHKKSKTRKFTKEADDADSANSGILIECVVEYRKLKKAQCELEPGQILIDREKILQEHAASGVTILREK
jgi:hypothetical protein